MKKSLISLAVAAGLTASGVANAAPTAYGFMDIAIVDQDSVGELDLVSTTSAFGLKGSEDLGDGMKAIYKIELQVDLDDRNNNITDRDQWLGLKGGFGKVLFGTTSSNYKQMGGKIDPFYRTVIQARSVGQQSALHRGANEDGGRMTSAIQYTSPNFSGITVVLNTTMHASADEASGVGIRYKSKQLTAWVDTLSGQGDGSGALSGTFDSATKVGVKFAATDQLTLGAQIESIDLVGGGETDVSFLSATFGLDKNNTIAFTYGITDDVVSGINFGIWHKLSKMTHAYVALNSTSDEVTGSSAADDDFLVIGLRKKF